MMESFSINAFSPILLAKTIEEFIPKATISLLHPGTVDTDLSRPFHKFVPAHKLFSTEKSAQFLINNIKNQSPASTGKFIAWDSSEIPW